MLELLDSVKKGHTKHFKDTNVKFQLARKYPPITGLLVDNTGLEYVLDRRFIAWGRFYLAYGKRGNSKTTLGFDFMKLTMNPPLNQQKGDALWIEVERAADLDYARKQGVDVDGEHFAMEQPETLEEGLTLAKEVIFKYAAKYPEGDGPPLCIFFDSLAGAQTQYESETMVIGAANIPGEAAKKIANFYVTTRHILANEKIIFLAANQLKDKIDSGGGFGAEKGEAMRGGEGPRFESTGQWKMVRTKDLVGKDDYGADRKFGSRHTMTAKRNKVGREGNTQVSEFDVYIKGGIDWWSPEVRRIGETYKHLINRDGAWCTWQVEGTTFKTVMPNDDGVPTEMELPIPTDKQFRDAEMAQMIRASTAAKELIRKTYEIPDLPSEEEVKEIEKENTKKRKGRKKPEPEDDNAIKAL